VSLLLKKKSPEGEYKLCVDQEWDVFNKKVEKVKALAQERADMKSLILTIGTHPAIWPGPPGIDPTVGSDVLIAIEKQKEIEEGTKEAAAKRDAAIRDRCKKPT
jgi:hypothetical protein